MPPDTPEPTRSVVSAWWRSCATGYGRRPGARRRRWRRSDLADTASGRRLHGGGRPRPVGLFLGTSLEAQEGHHSGGGHDAGHHEQDDPGGVGEVVADEERYGRRRGTSPLGLGDLGRRRRRTG